jgi:chromosome segregation ATPase
LLDGNGIEMPAGRAKWHGSASGRRFVDFELVSEDRSADPELVRLRAKAREQEREIARLRDEAAEASGELAQLGVEAEEHHRRERDLSALVERLRSEAASSSARQYACLTRSRSRSGSLA